jgi:hypothetical protein
MLHLMDGMSSRPTHHSTMRKSNATDATRVWRGYGTAPAWHLNRLQSAGAARALKPLDCSERKIRDVEPAAGGVRKALEALWETIEQALTGPEIAPRE